MFDRLCPKSGLRVPGYMVLIRFNVFYFKIFNVFYRNLISVAPHTHVIRSVTYHFLVNERKLPLTARSRAKWRSTQRSLSICSHYETEAKIKLYYQCVLTYYLVSPQLRHGKALNASGMLLPSPHEVCASIDPHCASPKHAFLSSRIPDSISSSREL